MVFAASDLAFSARPDAFSLPESASAADAAVAGARSTGPKAADPSWLVPRWGGWAQGDLLLVDCSVDWAADDLPRADYSPADCSPDG